MCILAVLYNTEAFISKTQTSHIHMDLQHVLAYI